MSGLWPRCILGSSVARWLDVGRKRPRRPAPVRPGLEQLERQVMLSSGPFLVKDIFPGPEF
jgi:hypothetical protein